MNRHSWRIGFRLLKPNGPDEIQFFEVDPGFKQDTYVQMAEARPGNRQ